MQSVGPQFLPIFFSSYQMTALFCTQNSVCILSAPSVLAQYRVLFHFTLALIGLPRQSFVSCVSHAFCCFICSHSSQPCYERFKLWGLNISMFQVRYTGYRDRPQEERQVRFQNGCREGHTEIVSLTYSIELQPSQWRTQF